MTSGAESPLAGQTVLVVGATGFIGSHLALRLVEQGVHVRGLARSAARGEWLARRGVELVEADLTRAGALRRAARGCSLLFSLATWSRRPNSWDAARRVNVDGIGMLMEAAVQVGARRVVHASSIAAYGPRADGAIDEAQPLRAVDAYGSTKAQGEAVALSYSDRIEVCILRPAQVYGPRGGTWTAGLFDAIKRGLPVLAGGGRGTFHPCYVENLVDAFCLAADRPGTVGQAFTIVDGVTTWREFVGHYARMIGRPPRSVPIRCAQAALVAYTAWCRLLGKPIQATPQSIHFLVGACRYSNDKAQRLLGWSPRLSLEEGMRRTQAWLRATGRLSPDRAQSLHAPDT